MSKKQDKYSGRELDDKTTFADMNVEGFSWYNPQKKEDKPVQKVTRKEQRKMIRAAYRAYLPTFIILIGVCALVFLLAYLWLKF